MPKAKGNIFTYIMVALLCRLVYILQTYTKVTLQPFYNIFIHSESKKTNHIIQGLSTF